MYYAQLMDDYKCCPCQVAEDIIIDKYIRFTSDIWDEVTAFCDEWNKVMEIVSKIKYIVSGYPDSVTDRYGYPYLIQTWHYDEDCIEEIMMVFKVVSRCIKEGFPIDEYALGEIPYQGDNGWIMDFFHYNEYIAYHFEKNGNLVHEIDFFIPHVGDAVPQKYEKIDEHSFNQYDASSCHDAVYV